VSIDGHSLDLEQFRRIVYENEPVILDKEALVRVEESYHFLCSFATDKVIYGINTGFGPMSQNLIPEEKLKELQYNIIRSHSSGMGGYLEEAESRAILLARLNCLMLGYSGVHPDLVKLMGSMLEHCISPCIPIHGGVGASGDLVQLAHLGLALIGEGEVYHYGEIVPSQEAFADIGLEPLKISLREGISLMNGVSGMTGVAALSLIRATNALQWSVALSSLINELVESYDDHFSEELNRAKLHQGQQVVAAMMRSLLAGSRLIQSRGAHCYPSPDNLILQKKLQETYSLRCIPQVVGPILDTLMYTCKVVENEMNSNSDNPIVDAVAKNVFHGGNFHGDYISMEMDKLKIAMTKLSVLSERQLNFLLNPRINNLLPPFICRGMLGLNFGLQGIQYTATSTTAENIMLSNPMCVHNIPSNNDNQDVVSMGFNSAVITGRVVANTLDVLAVEASAVVQAVDFLDAEEKLAPATAEIYRRLRSVFPVMNGDQPQYKKLKALKSLLETVNLQLL